MWSCVRSMSVPLYSLIAWYYVNGLFC
jgi:hypothetical protein